MRLGLHVVLVSIGAAVLGGCAADADASSTGDDAELIGSVRLANATVDDVVASAVTLVEEDVAKMTAAHPTITSITRNNRSQFTEVGNVHFLEVGQLIDAILETESSVAPGMLAGHVDALLRPSLLSGAGAGGVVRCSSDRSLGLLSYAACSHAEETNAFSRAKPVGGVDFAALRSAWAATAKGSSLDSALVLPVAFDHDPSLAEIRKAAGIRVGFSKAGIAAIDDFASASECIASEHPASFAPIASALRAPGIAKRFSFMGESTASPGWSRRYLVVVDEHHQVWGFQSGYAE